MILQEDSCWHTAYYVFYALSTVPKSNTFSEIFSWLYQISQWNINFINVNINTSFTFWAFCFAHRALRITCSIYILLVPAWVHTQLQKVTSMKGVLQSFHTTSKTHFCVSDIICISHFLHQVCIGFLKLILCLPQIIWSF